MMPPCRPLRRVSRSHLRAACQSFAACLRRIAAYRTGPATEPRHTGHGARVWGKPGRTAEIESKGASGVAAQPAWKRLILGTPRRCTPKGLAKIRGLGEARSRKTDELPGQPDYAAPPLRRVLRFRV